ncbi:uncharacterized protein BKA78DRAFT_187201 [Phyllosticta capitalensis]|uniref:uncharacterized protein n=1 Tax=Phyllosticta capitalensis TaxID=121624 RepID=UPI00312F6007
MVISVHACTALLSGFFRSAGTVVAPRKKDGATPGGKQCMRPDVIKTAHPLQMCGEAFELEPRDNPCGSWKSSFP